MALQIFTPAVPPSPGTTDKPEFKVLRADFGDGYSAAAPNGLNSVRRVLSLAWDTLLPEQARAITGFLQARAGAEAFFYTPSDEQAPVRWTCEDYTDKRGEGGLRTVTATFRQSFNLGA